MNLAGVVVLYNPDDDVKKNINSYIDSLDVLYVELMHMMIDGRVLQNGSNWYQKREVHL